jgi:CheY-like chemotaxis protein
MDGELQVQSQVGKGSSFYFRVNLPWASLVAEPAVAVGSGTPKAATERPQRLVGLRLLVVEDNAINQRVAMGLLTREGAHVTLASNGELGVAQVQGATEPFDAVLMDLQMPLMDGFTATRALREQWDRQRLPIIAMTANATESDRERCIAADMNDHVGKPFDLDHLVQVLLRCTGRMDMAAES